ncbi:chorismate--pyruvate lyase family protein [Aliidiomarina celeris]|uniref:chorismate--pyruvate lyase family protein n=1 Tax=Aliidiomarina celeris TaxID=2249428 RepID=UPI000DE92E61|nr:chorismate lyase [Aliidiomarina celeris]
MTNSFSAPNLAPFLGRHNALEQSAHWCTEAPKNEPLLSSWLRDEGSLTAKLKAACTKFQVCVLHQATEPCGKEEATFLNLTQGQSTLVREVLLLSGRVPMVYARSVLPLSSLSAHYQNLMALGSNPLGEQLFAHTDIRLGPIQVSEFKPDTAIKALDNQLNAVEAQLTEQPSLWGRRRRFELPDGPILVAEVFLSAAPCYA